MVSDSGVRDFKERTLAGEGVAGFLYELYSRFAEDECFFRAAAISYYAVFSLFPLLLVTVSVIGYILPTSPFLDHLESLIHLYVPGSAEFLVENLQNLIESRGRVGLVGVATLLWVSSAVFAVMTRSLNVIWNCEEKGHVLRTRIVGVGSVLFFGFLGLLSLAIVAGLRIVRTYEASIAEEFGVVPISDTFLWSWIPLLISLAMIFVIFAGIFMVFPACRNRFLEVAPGAALGALAFEVSKNVFVSYMGNTPPQQILHGSLTTMVVLMLWIYISALIFLLGAEFNVLLLHRRRREGEKDE
ncbi:MAG: YihY/virulence factor BrkB family protein [Bacillota bacterium]